MEANQLEQEIKSNPERAELCANKYLPDENKDVLGCTPEERR